jgi:hypothetical protein
MSIVVRFPAASITTEQYAEIRGELERAGVWPADGCLVHVAFGGENDIHVSEVWESREQFEAFGARLGPIFETAGVELDGQPEVFDALTVETF